jgi:selenocysteine lyase/cysteine desulfurase
MAPHGLPDVTALGTDIYLFSSYKTYGPHQGVMVVRRELADRLANQGHYFNAASRTKRFTPAGPDHAQIAAAAGMADYIDELYAHHFSQTVDAAARARAVAQLQRAHEDLTLAPLLDFLRQRRDLRILGNDHIQTPTGRVPTVAIKTARSAAAIATDLEAHGVMAGAGDFYAVRTLAALGCDPDEGVLRLSFVHYTSVGEVDQLIKGLDATLQG